MSETGLELKLAKELYEKKASDIRLLKVGHLSSIADYLLIASGYNAIQVKAIAEHVLDKADILGEKVLRCEGLNDGRWVVIDLGDVIVHIFHREDREYYRLDRLWEDGDNNIALPFDTDKE